MKYDNVEKVVLESKRIKIILTDGTVIIGEARGEWGAESWISYSEF